MARPYQGAHVLGRITRRTADRARFIPALLLVLFLAPWSAAQTVDVSFPLGGRYREGKYMPARVTAQAAPKSTLTLEADWAVPTDLALAGGSTDVIAPWLAARELTNPRWKLSGGTGAAIESPLRPLGVDERLVAVAGEPQRGSAECRLFPGRAVVTVPLDLARPGPLLSPAAAYETLDGVILDAGAAGRVGESQLAVLLAGGTAVAVRSDTRPEGQWPWRREGPYWVLRHDVAGPRTAIESEGEPATYSPTQGWVHGWPAARRRQAVVLAVVFIILMLAAALWRSRYAVAVLVGLSLAATGGVVVWGARASPVLAAGGTIDVWDGNVTQRDEWSYRTTLRPAEAAAEFRGLTRPVLAGRSHFRQAGVRLVCAADGRPERLVVPKLPADYSIAFVTRTVQPAPPTSAALDSPLTSPMFLLADRVYPGRVAGLVPPPESAAGAVTDWGTIVVDRSSAHPHAEVPSTDRPFRIE